jgi:hypothetical protein
LGGFTDRIGAKDKRDILTKMSPETTTFLHPDTTYHHPTPFEGRKPKRREARQRQQPAFDFGILSTRRVPTK